MSKLLIHESPLTVLPTLAKMLGLNEAIVVQQVHYWITNPKAGVWIDNHKWVYNTYEQWQEENFSFWSVDTVKRIFLQLEKIGVLISSQLSESKWDKTKYYRIDYDKLEQVVLAPFDEGNLPLSDEGKDAPSTIIQRIPETTESPIKTKKDYLDYIQEQAGNPASKKDLMIAEMYDRMDRGFRTSFTRNKNTDNIVKFIIQQEKKGDSLDRFVSWAMRDEFNASRIWEYAENPIKIKTRWTVAMSEKNYSAPQESRFSSMDELEDE